MQMRSNYDVATFIFKTVKFLSNFIPDRQWSRSLRSKLRFIEG